MRYYIHHMIINNPNKNILIDLYNTYILYYCFNISNKLIYLINILTSVELIYFSKFIEIVIEILRRIVD